MKNNDIGKVVLVPFVIDSIKITADRENYIVKPATFFKPIGKGTAYLINSSEVVGDPLEVNKDRDLEG